MRMLLARIIGFPAAVLLAMSITHDGHSQGVNTAAEPQYLMFQIFTAGPGFTTEAGKHEISRLPDPTFLDDETTKILALVGERGDDLHRLGIVVGPLALDHTDAQLRTLIERTFAIASKYKIAVGFHIDNSKFWVNRRDLWSNPANVEWLDWRGTPNTGLYLNWGQTWRLAPQACLNSPAMLNEARRLSGEVIGPAIAEQVAKLRKTGNEALFAGVIVGWETSIGRDFKFAPGPWLLCAHESWFRGERATARPGSRTQIGGSDLDRNLVAELGRRRSAERQNLLPHRVRFAKTI